MANTKTTHTFSTRLNKDDKNPVETKANIVWDVPQEQILALAARAVIIDAQSLYRIAGKIPTSDDLSVAKVLADKKTIRGSRPLTGEQVAKAVTSSATLIISTMEGLGMTTQSIKTTLANKGFAAESKAYKGPKQEAVAA